MSPVYVVKKFSQILVRFDNWNLPITRLCFPKSQNPKKGLSSSFYITIVLIIVHISLWATLYLSGILIETDPLNLALSQSVLN